MDETTIFLRAWTITWLDDWLEQVEAFGYACTDISYHDPGALNVGLAEDPPWTPFETVNWDRREDVARLIASAIYGRQFAEQWGVCVISAGPRHVREGRA